MFPKEDNNNIPTPPDHGNSFFLCDLVLTKAAVENKLKGLNPNQPMGPDKTPAMILKAFASELSLPLVIIYNKSLHEGRLPSD